MPDEKEQASNGTAVETATENPDEVSRIEPSVVATVVRTAAQRVRGVVSVSDSSFTRNLTSAITGGGAQRGVEVVSGGDRVGIDIQLTVAYGVPMQDIIRSVREQVRKAIIEMCGLTPVRINIRINDIRVDETAVAAVELADR